MQGKHAKHAKIENVADEVSQGTEILNDVESSPVDDEVSSGAVDKGMAEAIAEPPTELIEPVDEKGHLAVEVVGDAVSSPTHAVVDEKADSAAASLAPEVPAVAPPGVSANETMGQTAATLSVIDPETGAYVEALVPKKKSPLKAILITLGIIVALVVVAYGVGAYTFSQHFLPNTTFGDIDVSMQTADEVAQQIQKKVDDYQLDVVGGAFSYRATSQELGLSVDAQKMAQEMLESQNQWKWPLLLLEGKQEVSGEYALTYDADAIGKQIRSQVKKYNKGAKAPENATVIYDENADAFIVQPEVAGTQYRPKAVAKVSDEAVMTLTPLVALQPDLLIQPTIKSDDEKLVTAAEAATKMVSSHLKLSLDGQDAGEIGPDDLHDLIWFDEDLNPQLDEDALSVWIDGVVKRFDTVGTERSYTRPDGKEITVSGGEYGWEVDQDALREAVLNCVYEGSDIEMDIPCYQYAQVFNGIGNPDWGNRYADVDLSEQYVRFYDENGDLVWESDCISGVPDGEHDTVEGVWKINNKESPSKLIGRDRNGKKEYETMVTYWMAFEQNAIGFHDATWQPAFGGEMFRQGYGSHGCVNLPYDKAEELYGIIDWDDVVIVHW